MENVDVNDCDLPYCVPEIIFFLVSSSLEHNVLKFWIVGSMNSHF